jgi:hypothetical protein
MKTNRQIYWEDASIKAIVFTLDLAWFLIHVAGLVMMALLAICLQSLPKR